MEDSAESLVKLRQTCTLRDYILELRRLANRRKDISPSLLKSCFIGGWKPELRHDVKILKPKDVLEASTITQQLDTKLADLKVKSFPKNSAVQSTFRSPLQTLNSNVMHENKPTTLNVRSLTPEEVDFYRKNSLCFHCKEKYFKGHTCDTKQMLLINVQDSDSCVSEEMDNEQLEIIACALFRIPAPPTINTMKVHGFIKNYPVTILIDLGSSHNFVDLGLAQRVRGILDTGHTFNVKIAEGGKVSTHGTLAQISVKI